VFCENCSARNYKFNEFLFTTRYRFFFPPTQHWHIQRVTARFHFIIIIFKYPHEKIPMVKSKEYKRAWMAICRRRPQLEKSRERGLNWTFEPRHWSAVIKKYFKPFAQSCGPGQPKTKRLRRLAARVSQLPLAETHKLLTVRRIFTALHVM